jgi:hypothetical protein
MQIYKNRDNGGDRHKMEMTRRRQTMLLYLQRLEHGEAPQEPGEER